MGLLFMCLFIYCATILLLYIITSVQCLVDPWIEVPLLELGTISVRLYAC